MSNNPYSGQRLEAQKNLNHIRQEMKTASDFSKPIKQQRINAAESRLNSLKNREAEWNKRH